LNVATKHTHKEFQDDVADGDDDDEGEQNE
jgi:hypothetical protein